MIERAPDQVVGSFDAKTRLSELLERVSRGEEFTITRHGTPIARLVPVSPTVGADDTREFIQRWRSTAHTRTLGTPVRRLIEEGRR